MKYSKKKITSLENNETAGKKKKKKKETLYVGRNKWLAKV